jgi:hypothetical protein
MATATPMAQEFNRGQYFGWALRAAVLGCHD